MSKNIMSAIATQAAELDWSEYLFLNAQSLHAWLYESIQYEMEQKNQFGGRKVV